MRRPQKLQVFNGDTNGITKIHCINNKNVNVLFTKGSGRKKLKSNQIRHKLFQFSMQKFLFYAISLHKP